MDDNDNEELNEVLIDMPVIDQVIITEPTLVYSSEQNDFLEVIQIGLVTTDGQSFLFAMEPELAIKLFRDQ